MAKNIQSKCLSERGWARLLSEIRNGNVVPIIGNELLKVELEGESILLKDYLIQKLSEIIDVSYSKEMDYTDLCCKNYALRWEELDTDIYYEISELLKKTSFKTPETLQKLLSIDKFKLVLTTSFDGLVVKAMEEKWGKGNIKSISYEKRTNGQDVDDLTKPIVYQMFGKVDVLPHSFVLTEDDLLEFLQYWLNDNYKPKKLSNILKEKYLLVIGCNYPNWLFRFFLQSVKSATQLSSETSIGMIADSNIDADLVSFLSRIDAQMYDDAEKFINELTDRWNKYTDQETKNEIFVSYASEDLEIAEKVVNEFRNQGIKVWFDKRDLEPADDYAEKIKTDIQNSKAFIPILSMNVLTNERRFFKREWNWSIEESEWRKPSQFIFPLTIDSVNIQDRLIPKEFSSLQKIDFCNEDAQENIKKVIRTIRR